MQFISKRVLKKFINKEFSNIGFDENYAHRGSLKHKFISIKIFDITSTQANILKQTALSVGCDCATNKYVINNTIKKSDCILSGSIQQIELIAGKLKSQPFHLADLSENLLNEIDIELKKKSNSKIMGILNLSADSFSDGGEFVEIEKAINHAIDMIELGADCIDIGAQSTKPNSELISVSFEMDKVIPVLVALKTAYPHIEISIDTMNLATADLALKNGADIINNISSEFNSEIAKLVAKENKKLVIMHNRGNSKTMDNLCEYDNIINDIYKYLYNTIQEALNYEIKKENLIIDLGFGFAKNISQNFELLSRINEFKSLGCPILAGVSRKRFMQDTINTKEPKDADFVSALTSGYLFNNNIDYIRVHNVELTSQAKKLYERINGYLI